jgi:hypothetical protein
MDLTQDVIIGRLDLRPGEPHQPLAGDSENCWCSMLDPDIRIGQHPPGRHVDGLTPFRCAAGSGFDFHERAGSSMTWWSRAASAFKTARSAARLPIRISRCMRNTCSVPEPKLDLGFVTARAARDRAGVAVVRPGHHDAWEFAIPFEASVYFPLFGDWSNSSTRSRSGSRRTGIDIPEFSAGCRPAGVQP